MGNALFSNGPGDEPSRRHTIAALVDNEPGVLARVIGLFSGRGYNIDSLTVAEVDAGRRFSRINIVTTGTELVIEQIKALLDKLVPVHQVQDLTVQGPHVERELALVKVAGEREHLIQASRIADVMRARLVDSQPGSFIFEMTGTSDEVDAFIDLVRPVEVSRAGVVAMARGLAVLTSEYIGQDDVPPATAVAPSRDTGGTIA
ncbi:acetolactate synthase, small subunit [Arboricoccus pini]|uniref:acetolactate synthase n=1 Tax=Arboricoccus pini TaxID=1963835 RepID=A0A212QYP0_9PROT|nr:acetolactate synthase small subunit [Arboricoccus pini]SNB64835.1 acetolactate synthase, small subunit [Arboricoccus pini]